jgi:heavy metal sensor kinase
VLRNGRLVAIVKVARSEEPVAELVDQIRGLLEALVPLVLALAGLGGFFLAGRAFVAVDRITRTAAAISAEDLSRRLPDHLSRTPGELGRLAATFNHMLDRLEGAFQRQRQFTADASHELRTPLTLVLGQVDVALQRDRSGAEYRQTLEGVREDVVRLRHLVDVLLSLARTDAYHEALKREPIDLGELIQGVADAMTTLAEERGVGLEVSPTAGVIVEGDQPRLMQLLVNLVENALKHTPPGGLVRLTAIATPDRHSAVLSVQDTGSGISPEHLPHIFERFYRVDPGRASGGTGLGLAISQWIVDAHGGRIDVDSQLGVGSTFRVWLPRTAVAA